MRILFACIAIAFLTISGVDAQSIKYKKLQKATITDAGEIMSTYELSTDDIEKISVVAKKVKANIDYIVSHSTESGWPSPLSDFSYRIDHPDEIRTLNIRMFADLGDQYIVIVPAKENKGSSLHIKEDIFILFTKKGVEVR